MTKLNFGCGQVYLEGVVNADIDPNLRTDVLLSRTLPLPFKDNSFDEILVDNVLEHFTPSKARKYLEEFHRILKPKGRIQIFVPHFTGILTKYRAHWKGYGVNSFCDDRDLFKVVFEQILLISRCSTAGYKWLRWLNMFNPLFNMFGRTGKQFFEKFWPGGFEEYEVIMEVIK